MPISRTMNRKIRINWSGFKPIIERLFLDMVREDAEITLDTFINAIGKPTSWDRINKKRLPF